MMKTVLEKFFVRNFSQKILNKILLKKSIFFVFLYLLRKRFFQTSLPDESTKKIRQASFKTRQSGDKIGTLGSPDFQLSLRRKK